MVSEWWRCMCVMGDEYVRNCLKSMIISIFNKITGHCWRQNEWSMSGNWWYLYTQSWQHTTTWVWRWYTTIVTQHEAKHAWFTLWMRQFMRIIETKRDEFNNRCGEYHVILVDYHLTMHGITHTVERMGVLVTNLHKHVTDTNTWEVDSHTLSIRYMGHMR